jgi:photosystem II stability/assembly factor-like uncharacterized protein
MSKKDAGFALAISVALLCCVPRSYAQRTRPAPARPKPAVTGPPVARVEPNGPNEPTLVQIYGARVFRLYRDTRNPEVVYATTPRGLYKTTDKGFRWRFIFAPTFPDPYVTARENLGYYPQATALMFAQSKSSPEVMFVGANWNDEGRWPVILKSEDGGASWRDASGGIIKPTADQGQWISDIQISATNASVVYLSIGNAVYKTLNGARSWGQLGTGSLSVDPINGDHVIVGRVESNDGGATWSDSRGKYPFYDPISRQSWSSYHNIVFHPTNPNLLFDPSGKRPSVSEDGGSTWREIAITEQINCFAFSLKSDRVIYAGTEGGIYISQDRGLSWKKIFQNKAWSLAIITDEIIYAATGKGIWKTSNGGGTWHTANLMLPLPIARWANDQMAFDRLCLVDDSDGSIYVGGRRGYWITNDDGLSWHWDTVINDSYSSIVSVKKFADGTKFLVTIRPDGDVTAVFGVSQWEASLVRVTPQGKIERIASRSSSWSLIPSHYWPAVDSLFAVSESDPRTIYDGIRASDDGGFSWKEGSVAGADLRNPRVVVSPASPKIAYAISSGDAGAVFGTTNGGETWTKLLMTGVPQTVVPDPKEPTTVYAIIANQLLRSRNAGSTWEPIVVLSPLGDLSGIFAINPKEPAMFYLLGSHALWESKNGGKTWRNYQSGSNEDRLEKLFVSGSKVLVQGRYGIYRLSDPSLGWALERWTTEESTAKSPVATEESVISESPVGDAGTRTNPSKTGVCPDAAACMAAGDSLLKKGQYSEAAQVWDTVLELGGSLNFLVCRETGFTGCKPGTFLMTTKEVSFLDGRSQQVFSAPLSEVEVKGAQKALKDIVRSSPRPFVRFKLKVAGKEYNFVFKPMYIPCTDTNPPTCDEPGLSQQETVANYIARKLQSLKTQ